VRDICAQLSAGLALRPPLTGGVLLPLEPSV